MEQLNLKVGDRLREIRKRRNMTLDDVADVTGVSKPMLGQIERGQSVPTVTTLWKIATGLKTPFSAFLEERQAEYAVADFQAKPPILEENGTMRVYPLFAYDPIRNVEIFYIEFEKGCRHASPRHNDGVEEYVFVLRGKLQLVLNGQEITVGERQAVRFRADLPHAYHNPFDGLCAVYNTIFYPGH